ncbi:MAG: ribonuclease III [Myxococcales bacterium]|nr:ribonuclease III [Myxococcales bacterium]
MTADERDSLAELEGHLGHSFSDPTLLLTAVTHRSFTNENSRGGQPHNERLEFLGDSVLGLLVTELLMTQCPDASEGYLSLMRSRIVSESSLAELARSMDLGRALRVGRGEELNGGRDKPSLLADAFEAVLGALFVDSGFAVCQAAAQRLLVPLVVQAHQHGGSDEKSALQDLLQRLRQARPRYEVIATSGPEHEKTFDVAVYLDDRRLAVGSGRSKRAAEQAAAGQALQVLNQELA